tara:strand:- start:68 stop:286 length:219 start_codon:yes stop_codon:yes gene_type:complete
MNGYTNWETWNVASWIGNDELLYNISIEASDYADFVQRISWYSQGSATPDGVEWESSVLDRAELDELIEEHV